MQHIVSVFTIHSDLNSKRTRFIHLIYYYIVSIYLYVTKDIRIITSKHHLEYNIYNAIRSTNTYNTHLNT